VIAADGLTKAFGDHTALAAVTLEVPAGAVLAVLGHNGSGKTTFLRVLATLLRPTGGAARVGGHDVVRERDRVRRLLGVVGHGTQLYDDLTARENLAFAAQLAGARPGRPELDAALALAGLEARAEARVRTLSSGMRRRLALARALLGRPRVLLLDEPFAGLDHDSTARLEADLRRFRDGGGTALVVTHSLARALAVADRVAILAGGRLVAQAAVGPLDEPALRRLYLDVLEGSNGAPGPAPAGTAAR
jgi:ABC-2 type transport system ATP-binding protein